MSKSIVALIPCDKYDEELVCEGVKKGIELIGGLRSVIKQNERVLVKPNLLAAAQPSKAVTTHPAVFGAVLKVLQEEAYENVVYGDSSGVSASSKDKPADVCGLSEVAEKYNIKFGDFQTAAPVEFSGGVAAKKFVLCKEASDADAIISVCKMKTHALTKITGAVKNQYGCIFSGNKALGHAKYPNAKAFSQMLVDINNYLKPRLFIMDGIIAMEGNGPGSGDPTPMRVLLVSKDPVALDSVFARLVNLNPLLVPTIVAGEKQGLGNSKYSDISIITPDGEISADEAFSKYGNPNFNVDRKKREFWKLSSLFAKHRQPKHKPVANLDKCIGCGICQEACPVDGKAVHSGHGKKAEYDYTKCIRCYCCQEMCPEKAITRQE